MAIEIVDLPIENGVFPVRYVSLPEGNYPCNVIQMWYVSTKKSPKNCVIALK